MAITKTGTHVNFVKVPTMKNFDDITTKAAGTIYFIVDAKKIHLDGVMYGFNDSDIDLTPLLDRGGGVMGGDINMDGNFVVNAGRITFDEGGSIEQDVTGGGMSFHPARDGKSIILLTKDSIVDFSGSDGIKGLPDPIDESSPISEKYLHDTVIDKIGVAYGIASLDHAGKVPSDQLPSYVDDVLEYSDKKSFPAADDAEKGKLYIDLSNERVYRWSGSAYVNVSDGNAHLTIGTTSSTAHRGDHGETAYDHSQLAGKDDNPHEITKDNVGLGSVEDYGIASKAQAEGGSSDILYMTPLKTKNAIEKLAPKLSWTVVA